MNKVLVIMGSTASGKSDLAIELAKKHNGEIISCDSVQVYRGMDIGSAKISETYGIPHHLIDILDIDEEMNVMLFQKLAREKIQEITSRGKLPICVGGTGFYIKALLFDYQFSEETDEYDFSHLSNEELHGKLVECDPDQAQKIHVNNRQRLLRIFQQMSASQKTRSELHLEQKQEILYDAQIYYLMTQREVLKQRIDNRVDAMFDAGLVDEINGLTNHGQNLNYQSLSAIGYKEFKEYYSGEWDIDQVREKIKTHTRQFSKRQMTWFKHQLPGKTVDILNNEELEQMKSEIATWVNLSESN